MRFDETYFGMNSVEIEDIADRIADEFRATGELHTTVEKDTDWSDADVSYLEACIRSRLED